MDLSTLIARARVAWFRKAAEQGDAGAQNSLGWHYRDGEGVEKDPVEAVAWHRKAAEQGDSQAQHYLGEHYRDGEGVENDPVEAVAWYRKAAEQDFALAQYNLGVHYREGWGVEKDPVEAVAWFRKAAEQGDAAAQYNLGNKYGAGEGVEKDPVEAVAWFRKAAEQGLAHSQFSLGVCCRDGVGIIQNYEDAFRFFLKASVGLAGVAKFECDKAKSDLERNHLTQSVVLSLQRELSGSSKQSSKPVRTGISKDAQSFVWNRDGGRCVECGSNENLEFDHIIPVSKGGSNTARNLQLLCEPYNRRKGASI